MGIFKSITNKVVRTKPVQKLFNGYFSQLYMIPPALNTIDYLKTYGESGWLFACVSAIAKNVADSEWKAYMPDSNGEDQTINNNEVIELLEHPNPFLSRYELFELHQMYLDLVGKSFWYIAKDKLGRPKEIWLINPVDMIIIPHKEQYIKGYLYRSGTDTIPLNVDEVIFFNYPNPVNPYDGISPAESITNAIQTDKFTGQWNRNFFYNNAEPQGLLHVPDDIDDDDYDRLVAEWNDKYGGLGNAKKTAIIRGAENKVSYTPIQITQKDMDFINLKIQSRDEILGAYGVPRSILGIVEDVNRANAETAEYTMAKHVVKPRLRRLQDKINNELVPMFRGLSNIVIKFTDPVPENKDFIEKVLNEQTNKTITINESRQLMNKLLGTTLKDLPGGDTIYIGMGNIPISEVTSQLEQQTQLQQQAPQQEQPKDDAVASVENVENVPNLDDIKDKLVDSIVLDIKKQLKIKQAKAKVSNLDKDKYLKDFYKKTESQVDKVEKVWKDVFKTQQTAVLRAINSKKSITTKDLHDDIVQAISSAISIQEIIDKVLPLLQLYLDEHAKDMLDLLNVDESVFSVHDENVTKWLKTYCTDNITNVVETTKVMIKEELIAGEQLGEGIPQLAQRLKGKMENMTEYRARTIARTEVIGASNQGKLFGMTASKVVEYKEWLTGIDGRERDWHREVNGQRVKIDEPFLVHNEHMTGPGDPNGGADNVINCRCTILPYFPKS